MLQVVEHGGSGAAGSGSSCSWRTSHGRAASRSARPRVKGIAPGDAERAVDAQVEGVDLQSTLEPAAQRLLGRGAVEPGVLGAASC